MKRFCMLGIACWGAAASAAPISFERDVQPLLEKRCNSCHEPEKSRSGLDLTRLPTMLRGGDELGSAVVAGHPDDSPLIGVLTGELEPLMPEKGDALAEDEIELLRRWIEEGAVDDTPEFSAVDIAFFEREIRPLLFEHCFKCHAGDAPESGLLLSSRYGLLRGGARGPAAIAGDPAGSRLLEAVRHAGVLKMPQGGDRLSDDQVAALEEWIRRGLPWPEDQSVLTRTRLFTVSEADREHWAFRPLPKGLDATWSVDRALKARWRAAGIEPAPIADRRRLLRRVTYDLIGYPPTPEEIDAFVADTSPDAYVKVVARLLDSPHYGWRWGRHWLDYTRNGANGQSNRGPEMESDRYAAWVADCFNADRPWDWMARVHLAGDRMPAPDGSGYSIDQALAAAIPLNGLRTFQRAETDTFVLMDKLDEGIEFMGRSLMGVSLECARCHDHKFDPISQRDYYAMLGFFQSSWFAPTPVDAASPQEADAAVERRRELMREQARLNGKIRIAGTETSVRGGELRKKWYERRQSYLAPFEKRGVEFEVEILRSEVEAAKADGAPVRLLEDLKKTLADREASVVDFRARYFNRSSMKELGYEIHGHKSMVGLISRAEKRGLTAVVDELMQLDQFWTDEKAEWVQRHRFGSYLKTDPQAAQMAAWDDRVIEIQAELDRLAQGQMIVRCEGGLRRAEELEPFEQKAKAEKRAFYPELVPAYVGAARLLRRGDVVEPDQLIKRGFPEFFGGGAPELIGSGRLKLANWLTEKGSIQAGLVARTAVNRVWQHLFKVGLCRTPKELGRLGEMPEAPEVIDGLAARFVSDGWSMKRLIRQVVLTDVYKRSSVVTDEAIMKDPSNRWFARQNVRRLEAEPIQNTMAYLRAGKRFVGPDLRDQNLMLTERYFQNFDGPSPIDLVDRRVSSISASQALFLMNDVDATRAIADGLAARLGADSATGLPEMLDTIYKVGVQRKPSKAERHFAAGFVERRRHQTGASDPAGEVREFLHLLLCANEMIYIE